MTGNIYACRQQGDRKRQRERVERTASRCAEPLELPWNLCAYQLAGNSDGNINNNKLTAFGWSSEILYFPLLLLLSQLAGYDVFPFGQFSTADFPISAQFVTMKLIENICPATKLNANANTNANVSGNVIFISLCLCERDSQRVVIERQADGIGLRKRTGSTSYKDLPLRTLSTIWRQSETQEALINNKEDEVVLTFVPSLHWSTAVHVVIAMDLVKDMLPKP